MSSPLHSPRGPLLQSLGIDWRKRLKKKDNKNSKDDSKKKKDISPEVKKEDEHQIMKRLNSLRADLEGPLQKAPIGTKTEMIQLSRKNNIKTKQNIVNKMEKEFDQIEKIDTIRWKHFQSVWKSILDTEFTNPNKSPENGKISVKEKMKAIHNTEQTNKRQLPPEMVAAVMKDNNKQITNENNKGTPFVDDDSDSDGDVADKNDEPLSQEQEKILAELAALKKQLLDVKQQIHMAEDEQQCESNVDTSDSSNNSTLSARDILRKSTGNTPQQPWIDLPAHDPIRKKTIEMIRSSQGPIETDRSSFIEKKARDQHFEDQQRILNALNQKVEKEKADEKQKQKEREILQQEEVNRIIAAAREKVRNSKTQPEKK